MAIVSVIEQAGRESDTDQKLDRKYERNFAVLSSIATESPALVKAAVAVSIFDPSPWDAGSIATGVSAKQEEDQPLLWRVRVSYSSARVGKTDPAERSEDPLEWPAEIDVDWEPHTRAIEKDLAGTPILNSAGFPFENQPEIDESRPVITITRCQATFNLATAEEYYDAINSDEFLGFQPGSLKIRMKARRDNQNGIYFWRVTVSIHISRVVYDDDDNLIDGGWLFRPQDKGYQALDSNGKPYTIPGAKAGEARPEATLLDGEGGILEDDAEPVYLSFHVYPQLPFTDLNLL